MRKTKATIKTVMAVLSLLLLVSFAAADAHSEIDYGGNEAPLLNGSGTKTIVTKDVETAWLASTNSVLFFVYADSADVVGTITYTDGYGTHTSKWEIKDGGYGYIKDGSYQRAGALSDSYAFISVYPSGLVTSRNTDGSINTGITVTIDTIAKKSDGTAGTASLDSIGFYIYDNSDTVNGRFLGSLSHLKKINSVLITGATTGVLDVDAKPSFVFSLGRGSTDKMELVDEIRTNIKDSKDVISKSAAMAGANQRYTWGNKYALSLVFTAKAGSRFDSSNMSVIRDGTDYTRYVTCTVSNLGKTLTVKFADSTAVYAKKAITEARFTNLYLTLREGRTPIFTGKLNVNQVRDLPITQAWHRASDGAILTGNAERDVDYYYTAEFEPGDLFFFKNMPEIKVNDNSLVLYTRNGYNATAEINNNRLYLKIEGFKALVDKNAPTPVPDSGDSGSDVPVPDKPGNPDGGDITGNPTGSENPDEPDDPVITVRPDPNPNDSPFAGEKRNVPLTCAYIGALALMGMGYFLKRNEEK